MKGDDFCTTVYRSVDAVILAHIIKSFLLAIGKSKITQFLWCPGFRWVFRYQLMNGG